MKAQIKAIVASAVVIVLCLAAVGGVTYSWFSDSEESTIDITAGKIDVTATWGNITLSSYNYSNTTVITENNVDYTFPFNSGKAKMTEISDYGLLAKTITVKNMVPGDSISFDISDVTLTTDINVLFSYGCSIQTIFGPSENPFDLKMTQLNDGSNFGGYNNYPVSGSGNTITFTGIHVDLAMKTSAGNEYQGSSYKIQFFVKAIQGNMPSSTTTAINTSGINEISLQSNEGEQPTQTTTQATMTFDGTGLDAQDLSITLIPGSTNGYSSSEVGENDTILGGISVTSSAEEHALVGTWTTISFDIPGLYESDDLNVYHNGVLIISAGSVVDGYTGTVNSFSATYNNTTGKTTIKFDTSLGFSKYHVAGNFPVACDGKYYKAIDSAISAADDGSRIVLLKSITRDTDIRIESGQKITLDLNGKDITGNKRIRVYGSLDIVGQGKIVSSDYPIAVYSNNNTSVSNHVSIGPKVTLTNTNDNDYALALFPYYDSSASKFVNNGFNTEVTINGTINGVIGTLGTHTNDTNRSKLTIDGATINGQGYFPGNVDYIIKNTTFNSETTALTFKGGYIDIQDCKFNCEKTLSITPAFVSCSNGGFDANTAIYIEQKNGYPLVKSVTLSNNTFNTPEGFIGNILQYSADEGKLITFDSDGEQKDIVFADMFAASISVTLQTFKTDGVTVKQSLPCVMYFTTLELANSYSITLCESQFSPMKVKEGTFGNPIPLVTVVNNSEQLAVELKKNVERTYLVLENDCNVDITPWIDGTGTFGTENTRSITIDLNGHTLIFNNTNNDWNGIYIKNEDATLTLKNGKITNSGYNNGPWNRHDINFHCKVELYNIISDKAIAVKKDSILKSVDISDDRADDDYLLWIQATGATVTIEDCNLHNTKSSGTTRGIAIKDQYVPPAELVTLKVSGTSFETTKKAAVLVTSTAGANISWGEGNDISKVEADSTNAIWNDKDRESAWDLVTVTGCTKIKEP